MPQDEEMHLVQTTNENLEQNHQGIVASTSPVVIVNGPPSPAHSDSDASSSSLELGSRGGEQAQLKCRLEFYLFIYIIVFLLNCCIINTRLIIITTS